VIDVRVEESPLNDTPEHIDFSRRYDNRATTAFKSPDYKGTWLAKEPETFVEKLQALFTNTFVEIFSTVIASVAIFHPTYFSLAMSIITYVVFIGIPAHMIQTPKLRIKIYDLAGKVLMGLTFIIITTKLLFIDSKGPNSESWGVYLQN
jgi:hypothetical protein